MNEGRHWRRAALPFAQAVYLVWKGDTVAVVDKFREAFGALAAESNSPDELLWRRAFAAALGEALRRARVDVQQTETELAKAVEDELADAFEFTADFQAEQLINPTTYGPYQRVRGRFPAFVRRIDPAFPAEAQPDYLRAQLDDALDVGLIRAWSADTERFKFIVDRVQGPVAENARQRAAWMKHYGWVREKFEQAPVFAPEPDTPSVALAQVYVRLRCVRHELLEQEDEAPAERSRRGHRRRAHVGHLHDDVWAWLDARDPDDRIRIVAGGPGSGKSSFAKAFASDVILGGGWRVVFVELQRLTLRGDLRDDLRRHFDHCKGTGEGFPADPMDWCQAGTTPCLLVFDGLDELARSDAGGGDLTRRFIHNLKWLLERAQGQAAVKALVLGRSTAAEEGRRDAELPLESLLHVLPLRPPTRRDLLLDDHAFEEHNADLVDPTGAIQADQRFRYWGRWCVAVGAEPEPAPEGLTHGDLADLNAEPLLLHLLIVSGYLTPERWREAADNRNRVYEAIFRRVYERDRRAGKWALAQIDEAEFFTLMECMGLATWAGGGRTGSEEEFSRLRGIHAAGKRERKFAQLPNADLKSVAVQFYARRELGDSGYEFIHKSFGEYLIARALLAAAWRARDDLERRDAADVALDWARVAGLDELNHFILNSLCDECRLLSLADAVAVKESAEELMSWTLVEGMPVHRLGKQDSFRALEARQRYAEGALLAVLNAVVCKVAEEAVSPAMVLLDWPEPLALAQLIQRLRVGRLLFSTDRLFERLGWSELKQPDISGKMISSHFLRNADLSNLSMQFTDFKSADLTNANMLGANLRSADLRRALVGKAYLAHADLRDANLLCANLGEADLGFADLQGANLEGAFLGGANLREANLGGANLRGADLGGAVNVTQTQLHAADGSADTRLPDGYVRPVAWSA